MFNFRVLSNSKYPPTLVRPQYGSAVCMHHRLGTAVPILSREYCVGVLLLNGGRTWLLYVLYHRFILSLIKKFILNVKR